MIRNSLERATNVKMIFQPFASKGACQAKNCATHLLPDSHLILRLSLTVFVVLKWETDR